MKKSSKIEKRAPGRLKRFAGFLFAQLGWTLPLLFLAVVIMEWHFQSYSVFVSSLAVSGYGYYAVTGITDPLLFSLPYLSLIFAFLARRLYGGACQSRKSCSLSLINSSVVAAVYSVMLLAGVFLPVA